MENPLDPINHPLDGLIRDHEMVRKLAAAYRGTDDKEVKKQAGKQIVQAVHNHSRAEENIFYPRVRHLDAPMVRHFEQQHLEVDDLVATLQGMALDDAHADRLLNELIDKVLHHIEQEEKEFFPKLEQAGMDMAPLGLELAAFEANLVHLQAAQSAGLGSQLR